MLSVNARKLWKLDKSKNFLTGRLVMPLLLRRFGVIAGEHTQTSKQTDRCYLVHYILYLVRYLVDNNSEGLVINIEEQIFQPPVGQCT